MSLRGLRTGLAVAVAMGAAACSVAPPATPTRDAGPSSSSSAQPTSISSASANATSPVPTLGEFGAALDIGAVDSEFSSRVLEFASTGSLIIASAETGAEAAPDLYSILPRTGEPSLLWRNPERDHSLVKLGGDGDTVAFVDMAVDGEPGWTLWLIPESNVEPLILDEYHGDSEVAALVPSFSVYWPYVAWTAFEVGPDGTTSQLLVAEFPDWRPTVVAERAASRAELWFPHVYGASLLYTELVYSEDRQSDERSVWLTDVRGTRPERLDSTGLATMPVMNQSGIAWKEGDPGFHMLNWGVVEAYDVDAETTFPITDTDTNFPSAGERYMTWWRVDSMRLEVWDAQRGLTHQIAAYDGRENRVLRPHIAGSLMTWLFVDETTDPSVSEIRYAFLP